MSASVVPVQTRSERFTSTVRDDFPEVTGLEAEWRMSPVRDLADLLDGELDGARLAIEIPNTDGVVSKWVESASSAAGVAGVPEDRAAAAAWSAVEDVLEITIDSVVETPVHLDRVALGVGPRAAHTLIRAKAGSSATLVVSSSGAARLAENVEILVEAGANLTVVFVQEWDSDAVQLGAHYAMVAQGAHLKHILVSLSGAVVRVNPSVRLAGEGSGAEMLGVSFAGAHQHIEHRVFMHHEGRNTRGRVTYKGALQGAGARTVWIGDVLIGRGASGTDSYEQNRNLLLSEGTRADSIPNLEIETGDIVGAGHASATGRFDDEQLFYLQSRGIPEEEARRLVVLGFLAEIIQQVGDSELEVRLRAAIEAELGAGVEGR